MSWSRHRLCHGLLVAAAMVVLVSLAGVADLTSDAGGPYTIAEGDALPLDGSQSTSSSEITAFAWDLDGDPAVEAVGVAPIVSWSDLVASGIDDDGAYTITLALTNAEAENDSDTASVMVTNAPPVVDAGHTYDIDEGESLALDGSATFDHGDDALGPYDWDIDGDLDYGDGVTGVSPTVSWAMLEALGVNDDGEYTVSLRVADEDGGIGYGTARLTIHNTPPVADADGPFSITEGDTLVLTGTASDISSADTFFYVWDIDGQPLGDPDYDDGVADATWIIPWWVLLQFGVGDNGSYTARLQVMDDDGSLSFDTSALTIINAPPVVTCPGPLTVYLDEELPELGGTFTDPGDDSWEGTVDWGDGTPEQPIAIDDHDYTLPAFAYTSSPPGATDYAVTVTIRETDPEAAEGSCTFTVTVIHDITPPDVAFTATPPDPSDTTLSGFEWTGTDDFTAPEDILYSTRLDDGDWSAWSTATNLTFDVPTQGEHAFEVRAKDEVDNISDPIEYTWVVDLSGPRIRIDVPVEDAVYIVGSLVIADWTVTDLHTWVVSVDASYPDGAPIDTRRIANRRFDVSATDAAGNTEEASVHYAIGPDVVPIPPEPFPEEDERPWTFVDPDTGQLYVWSFLDRPLPAAIDEEGELVIIGPARYTFGETIGVEFHLWDYFGVPFEDLAAQLVIVTPCGSCDPPYEEIAVFDIPFDPGTGIYALELPTSSDGFALAPGCYEFWIQTLLVVADKAPVEILPAP